MREVQEIVAILEKNGLKLMDYGPDGMMGRKTPTYLRFIFSCGMGWEHLSVSNEFTCPKWDEMCMMKGIFWKEEETCVQYHPARADYVNYHPNCLHIFRPIGIELPKAADDYDRSDK